MDNFINWIFNTRLGYLIFMSVLLLIISILLYYIFKWLTPNFNFSIFYGWLGGFITAIIISITLLKNLPWY